MFVSATQISLLSLPPFLPKPQSFRCSTKPNSHLPMFCMEYQTHPHFKKFLLFRPLWLYLKKNVCCCCSSLRVPQLCKRHDSMVCHYRDELLTCYWQLYCSGMFCHAALFKGLDVTRMGGGEYLTSKVPVRMARCCRVLSTMQGKQLLFKSETSPSLGLSIESQKAPC